MLTPHIYHETLAAAESSRSDRGHLGNIARIAANHRQAFKWPSLANETRSLFLILVFCPRTNRHLSLAVLSVEDGCAGWFTGGRYSRHGSENSYVWHSEKRVIVEDGDPAISAMQNPRSFGTRGGEVFGTLSGLERDLISTIHLGWHFSAESERLPRNHPGERWRGGRVKK